jgi:hypothetical protein
MVGTLAFVMISSWFLFTIAFSHESSEVAQWITFGVCCVVGVFIGLLMAKLLKVGAAVLTGWGGVCLGLMLYTSFIFQYDSDKKIIFWIFIVVMALTFALLGYFMFNHAVIISTAIIGSYGIIRGISLYAGGFPNEMLIIEQIKNGQLTDFDNAFYGYLAGFVVLAIGCMVFQYKMYFNNNDETEHPYHRFGKRY